MGSILTSTAASLRRFAFLSPRPSYIPAMNWSRIAAHYICYFVFMALLGTMVSFTYVNVYYVPFKNSIIRNFYQRKQNSRK
jgi:hypothetical protein